MTLSVPIEGGKDPGQYAPGPLGAASMLEFTDWAVRILTRSHEAARRFNPRATVRLSRMGTGVQFVLVDEPEPGDEILEREDFTLYVEPGIDGRIDVVEPHDQLILRPESP